MVLDIDSYHDILLEFNLIISTIYHNNVLSADILTRSYGWVNGYAYNPFHIWNNDNAMIANIKNTKTILEKLSPAMPRHKDCEGGEP